MNLKDYKIIEALKFYIDFAKDDYTSFLMAELDKKNSDIAIMIKNESVIIKYNFMNEDIVYLEENISYSHIEKIIDGTYYVAFTFSGNISNYKNITKVFKRQLAIDKLLNR